MKTFRLIGMALVAVLMCVNFASCSDNEENVEEEMFQCNAKGIQIEYDEAKAVATEFLIDDGYIIDLKLQNDDSYHTKLSQYIVYERFNSMQIIYDFLSNEYITNVEINEHTDFSKFLPNPQKYVNKMKYYLGEYDYIAFKWGTTYLFNRTGDNL